MNRLVVVDTSVFVNFLQGKAGEALSVLILNNQVLLSQVVRLELLAGVGQRDARTLNSLLASLRCLEDFPPPEPCIKLLDKVKAKGRFGGVADLLILADTIRRQAVLFTHDQKLAILAKQLAVPVMTSA